MTAEFSFRVRVSAQTVDVIFRKGKTSQFNQRIKFATNRSDTGISRVDSGQPSLSHFCQLRFVEIVVLVVFRALQGQLQRETILGDLVHPNAWRDL